MRRLLAIGLLGGLLCGCADDPTQLMVVVATDLSDSDAAEIAIQVGQEPAVMTALSDVQSMPRTLAVVREGGALGPFPITIRALDATGAMVSERVHMVRFVEGESLMLALCLSASCVDGPSCGSDETCAQEGCVSQDIVSLPLWVGTIPDNLCSRVSTDAGMSDAGLDAAMDAAMDAALDASETGTEDATSDVTMVEDFGPCSCAPAPRVIEHGCGPMGCTVMTCEGNWADCDGDYGNGCEVNLQTNTDHCGSCTEDCVGPAGGRFACVNGSCTACFEGRGDCGPGICLDSIRTAERCGSCERFAVCPDDNDSTHHVTLARCVDGHYCDLDCEPNWGDCDGNTANGCETRIDTESNCRECGVVCQGGDECGDEGCEN